MPEFRGKLYIFVDPSDDGSATAAAEPDDVFGRRRPGEALWYLQGWAIGRSARGTYCARTSPGKMRSFETFAEAMDFLRPKRRSRPQETFYLVYEVDGRKAIVATLEQIQRLDSPGRQGASPDDAGEHPHLAALTARVGKIVAANALQLLQLVTEHGEAAARERFSQATYERLRQVLREAELLPAEV